MNFRDLGHEQQDEAREVFKVIKKLAAFKFVADPALLQELLPSQPEQIIDHLWESYCNLGRDPLAWWNSLSECYKSEMICCYLFANTERIGYLKGLD